MSVESIDGMIVIPGLEEPGLGAHVGPNATFKRYIQSDVPLRHLKKGSGQMVLVVHASRSSVDPMTSSDGNSEGAAEFRVNNEADNAGYCRQRAVNIRCRNYSGASLYHQKGLDIEIDNRGSVTDYQSGLRIYMKNLVGSTLAGGSRALEIEMGEQAAPTGHHRAIDLRHNDPSSVTYPTAIVIRGDRTTNGFVYGIDFQQYGLDLKGAASAASAPFKFSDDGQNADLANAVSGTIVGVIKVVIGTTVGYIGLNDGYTAS